MTALQEYDLEINPAKNFKGKVFCLLVSQCNDPEQEQLQWNQEEGTSKDNVNVISTPTSKWYDAIIFFLTHGSTPQNLYFKKCVDLGLRVAPY